jgi:hypothetical protein
MAKSTFIIGIDLGTTNCTMAYASLEDANKEIIQFTIPQAASAGTHEENPILPSFLYFTLPEEAKKKIGSPPWDPTCRHSIGLFARDRGSEVPGRMIASAKSWLCHNGINRREKILPQTSDDEKMKMSPLEAIAELLKFLRDAWNYKMPATPFCDQQVLITVPASFDPGARQLVQEAATLAQYPDTVLLEEPQAAFYSWLHRQGDEWRKHLSVGDSVLVVDIGGGTTDFSLISVLDQQGDLALERLAVGSHLLLGGDNIDLTLAYLAKNKLEEKGHEIDEWQLQSLVHACRQTKELFLSETPPEKLDVAIMGRGSRLIGGTIKTSLTRKECLEFILNGFLPAVSAKERSPLEKRLGMQQIGLPYAQDARISCQLAKFLSMTGETESQDMESFIQPSAILFNGGTMKSTALRDRFVAQLNSWAAEQKKPSVRVLPDPDYDFAVSRGAVFYGMARNGQAIRIRSGTSRSYFIGVEDSRPAVPGIPPSLKAICVVPFGMEEGTERELEKQEFALVLGEQATFRFFSHATPHLPEGIEPQMGTIVKNWGKILTELHPIETRLDKTEGDSKTVRVRLLSKVTEMGVLELWCLADDGRKWKLEFDLRRD